MVRRVFFLLLWVCLSGIRIQAQEINPLKQDELAISEIYKQILAETSYSRRDSLNAYFYRLLKEVLGKPGSFNYPFDSIRIGKLKSADSKFRVFTWNIPEPGGYHSYFGFMQVRRDDGSIKLIELVDGRDSINDPKNERLTATRWMAALYYQLADFKTDGRAAYILLGYDFNNLFTSKKIIEVLTFDANDYPIFGLPVFNVDGKYSISRVVFEFNARAGMVLKYLENSKMLVFDHLAPSRTEFTGDFQHYGPDGSFDGFKLEGNRWVYVRDLDLRNPHKAKPKPVKAPVEIKEPGFLYKPASTRKSK